MNKPKISVLIPTYCYARYLPEAIDSVLAQDCPDFELLIADDCSPDNTAEVVRPYCEKDARIRFVAHAKNMGMVNNWNFCLEEARGDYVKFLFGDDTLCHRQALGRLRSMLEAEPRATLATSSRIIIDENSKVVDFRQTLSAGRHNGRKIIIASLMESGKNLVGEPSVVMFRKADAKRGFNPAYLQVVDCEMWFHLLEKGDLVYDREPLSAFRCHSQQKTESNTAAGIGSRENAVFYSQYACQDWLPRKVVFPILLAVRREHSAGTRATDPEIMECERRLIARFGANWRWAYCLFYLRYRLAKPFRNIAHSIQKRIFRRSFKPDLAGSS